MPKPSPSPLMKALKVQAAQYKAYLKYHMANGSHTGETTAKDMRAWLTPRLNTTEETLKSKPYREYLAEWLEDWAQELSKSGTVEIRLESLSRQELVALCERQRTQIECLLGEQEERTRHMKATQQEWQALWRDNRVLRKVLMDHNISPEEVEWAYRSIEGTNDPA